jgi:hypothetical protein
VCGVLSPAGVLSVMLAGCGGWAIRHDVINPGTVRNRL